MEERELEEEEEDQVTKEQEVKEEVKVEQGSCLVVVRPDGSSLLLRAEVNLIFVDKSENLKEGSILLLRAEVPLLKLIPPHLTSGLYPKIMFAVLIKISFILSQVISILKKLSQLFFSQMLSWPNGKRF